MGNSAGVIGTQEWVGKDVHGCWGPRGWVGMGC